MRTPKCSSVSETTLIAASSSGPSSAAISTEVSNRTGTLRDPRVAQLATERPEILLECWVRRGAPQISQLGARHPLAGADGTQLSDRATGDGDGELLPGFGPSQNLADVVAQLLLGDRHHRHRVAIVLPAAPSISAATRGVRKWEGLGSMPGFPGGLWAAGLARRRARS